MTSISPEILLADSAWLRNLTRRLTSDAEAAADLQQELAVAVLNSDGRPIGRAWVATVARNLAALVRRRSDREARRLQQLSAPEASAPAADLVAAAELQQRAVAAVLELPEAYRDTVLLRFLRGLSLEQTARHLGVPIETVRTRQKRALAQLRTQLLPRRSRALFGLSSMLTMGAAMQAKHVLAVAAAVLVLGLATVPLWYSPADPSPPLPANAVPLAATGELPPIDAPPLAAESQEPEKRVEVAPPKPAKVAAAPADAPADKTGSIAATVVWADDSSPVADTAILCRRSHGPAVFARTNAQGVARFDELEVGGYYVSAGTMRTMPAQVEAGKAAPVALRLDRGFTVRGQVLDPSGAPVSGAEIFVRHAGMWPAWAFPRTRSDANGNFEVPGVASNQTLGARERHWGVAKGPVLTKDPIDNSKVREIVLRFEKAGASSVRGRVVDPSNRPVKNAWVQVHKPTVLSMGSDGTYEAPPPPSLTHTDGNGEFVAEWLGEGQHKLLVYGEGFAPHTNRLELTLNEVARADVQLAPGARISGTVRDAAGNVVVGALVRVPSLKAPQKAWKRIGSDGKFAFEDLPPGDYALEAVHKGHSKLEHTITVVSTEVLTWDAVLTQGKAVVGRLLDHADRPLANWMIERPFSGRYARTDADGRFTLPDCKAEGNTLRVRPEYGHVPYRMSFEGVAASATERTFVIPADRAPSATLRGQVLDDTGVPLPEVAIHLAQHGQIVHNKTRTRGDGTFEIGSLPPGDYRVLPRHKAYRFAPAEQHLTPHSVIDVPAMRGTSER